MYQLFYMQGSCSLAVHVLLREIGVPFELTKADTDQKENSKLLKANPRGQVPTLVVDGKPLVEGAAILTYLCEVHKSPLLPSEGWGRAKAQQWLAFANSSLHPLYGRYFHLKKQIAEFETSEVYKLTHQSIQKSWDMIEKELEQHEYIAGDAITVGDLLLTVIANWNGKLPQPITLGEKTKAYLGKVSERAAFRGALEAEQLSYKAAA